MLREIVGIKKSGEKRDSDGKIVFPGRVVYTYSDGSVEKFDIKEDGDEFFIVDRNLKGGKGARYLINDQDQINSMVENKNFNFAGCIFLVRANFKNLLKGCSEMVGFEGAYFSYGCDFEDVEFKNGCDFSDTCFFGVADFLSVKFFEETKFDNAKFYGKANFKHSTFKGKVNPYSANADEANTNKASFESVRFFDVAVFTEARFEILATFASAQFFNDAFWAKGTEFHGKVDFKHAKFSKTASFQDAEFATIAKKPIDFESAYIEKLLVLSRDPNRERYMPLPINLNGAIINKINYTGTPFSPENRETLAVLKNLAISQRDQVNALEFSKQEMEIHLAELKNQKDKKLTSKKVGFWKRCCLCAIYSFYKISRQVDICVLYIEKWVSCFGTNPLMALAWFVAVNSIFFGVYHSGYDLSPGNSFRAFVLVKDIVVKDECGENIDLGGWFEPIRFLHTALNAFLIYEFVKSLRKFSRRL